MPRQVSRRCSSRGGGQASLPEATSRHYTTPLPQAERGIGSGPETDVAGRSIPVPSPPRKPHVGPPARATTHTPRTLQPRAPPRLRMRTDIDPAPAARVPARNPHDSCDWQKASRPSDPLIASTFKPPRDAPHSLRPDGFAHSGLTPETLGNRCRQSRLPSPQPINSRRSRGACWERRSEGGL